MKKSNLFFLLSISTVSVIALLYFLGDSLTSHKPISKGNDFAVESENKNDDNLSLNLKKDSDIGTYRDTGSMSFQVEVPVSVNTEPSFNSVKFTYPEGIITLFRQATDSSNVLEHVQKSRSNLNERYPLNVKEKNLDDIQYYSSENEGGERIVVLMPKENLIYIFSIENLDLSNNLDSLVESFEYLGE